MIASENAAWSIRISLVDPSLVRCARAVENADAAGTYSVTWSSTPPHGAPRWRVAVQWRPATKRAMFAG
jgi:hypothetical protein